MTTAKLYRFQPREITLSQDNQVPDEIPVLPIGQYNTYIGEIAIDDKLLSQMAENFNRGVPHDKLPIDELHHDGKAPGWITKLTHKAGDGLYATVEWTKYGKELLTDKLYRFVSPEFNPDYIDSTFGKRHGAVMSALALTNRPMLQNLPALLSQGASNNDTSNTTILYAQEGAYMNLDEIRAKSPADVTEEEKSFLAEHQAELTDDERTNFGLESGNSDSSGEGDGDNADAGTENNNDADDNAGEGQGEGEGEGDNAGQSTQMSQGQTIQMSQAQYQALKSAADAGAQAKQELDRNRIEREAEGYLLSQSNRGGSFLPKSKDKLNSFLFSLEPKQRQAFKELMAEAPKGTTHLTQEIGDGGAQTSAATRLSQLAQDRVSTKAKDGETITFSQALDQVTQEHPELVSAEYGVEGA